MKVTEAQKDLIGVLGHNEEYVLKSLQKIYKQALNDVDDKLAALLGRKDVENLQTIINQVQYQNAIKEQLSGILDAMNGQQYKTISDYLQGCYTDSYIGTMRDLAQQGIPLIVPIQQGDIIKAVTLNSKLSKGLYDSLGEDVNKLKKTVATELTRGIATGGSYDTVAQAIARKMIGGASDGGNLYRAQRIARTEGHRVQSEAQFDALHAAKKRGADVVKQWRANLDAQTRDSHAHLDGEIHEIDDKFSNGLQFPGEHNGPAAEVINCRCRCAQRAKWALDDEELEELQKRAEYFGIDKSQSFEEYKKNYLRATESPDSEADVLKERVDKAEKEKDKAKSALDAEKNKYARGEYVESYTGRYYDVSALTEEDVAEMRKAAETTEKSKQRLAEISEELEGMKRPRIRDFSDEAEYDEAIAAYYKKRDKLTEEQNSLFIKYQEQLEASTRVKRYEEYTNLLNSLEERGIVYRSDLVTSIKAYEAEYKAALDAVEEAKKIAENNDAYYSKYFKSTVRKTAEEKHVEYRAIEKFATQPTKDEIIQRLAGGDMTQGSCASLGFAYIGNVAGYDVLDFRDGESRYIFSHNNAEVLRLRGAVGIYNKGYNGQEVGKRTLMLAEKGKEYYFVNGSHAAIVRRTEEGVLQYLELQAGGGWYENGWHNFTDPLNRGQKQSIEETLAWRFGTKKSRTIYGHKVEMRAELIDIESLIGNPEFEKLLGYINTAPSAQRKSHSGTIK